MSDKLSPMQQEMLSRADEIFKSVGKAVNAATEFGKEQIPDIAYQFIAFNRAYITTLELIFVVLFSIGMWLWVNVGIRDTFKYDVNSYVYCDARVGAIFSGVIISIISVIGIIANLKPFFLVWFAPKIFLIQGMVNLAKGIL